MRGWMRVRVPRGRSGTRERLYGNGGRSQPPPGALGHPGPRFPLAPGRGVRPDLLPLQSGSALRRRMLSRRQSPRRAPSQPRSASGTPGGSAVPQPQTGGMLSPFPLCASQEPPPQPPGASHRLHQPCLLHLRGGAQRVAPGPRRSPQEAGRGPGRGAALPEPRWTAGPVTLGGGAVVRPAPLWATEPVPWASPEPPQSWPPQETQIGRPDTGRAGAGRLLAVCGHSPEPAGVPAGQGGQAGAATAPDPARPGAATAALPGGAEAAREAGSARCLGPGGSARSSRRPATGQDVATAAPCAPPRPRSCSLLPSPAQCSRRNFPPAQLPRPLRCFPLLSLSRIKRQGLGVLFAHLLLRKGKEKKCRAWWHVREEEVQRDLGVVEGW